MNLSIKFEFEFYNFKDFTNKFNRSKNVTEDDQTRQIRSQLKEWLLHVGVQQLNQYSAAHPAGEGR